jgi:alkylated DNA nucleotide flippase Atl1
MDETRYRESRLCRLFGNPVVYQMVVFLENGGASTPGKLAKLAGRSVQTVRATSPSYEQLIWFDTIRQAKRFAIG